MSTGSAEMDISPTSATSVDTPVDTPIPVPSSPPAKVDYTEMGDDAEGGAETTGKTTETAPTSSTTAAPKAKADVETNGIALQTTHDTPAPAAPKAKAAATSPTKAAATPKEAATTPKKRAAPAKKVKKENGDDDEDDASEEGTPKKKAKPTPKKDGPPATPTTERKRKAPASRKQAKATAIARSYDECSEADKALLDMRDAGKNWADIRRRYQEITGDTIGQSTLPNRYARLKSNFTVIKEEDNAVLLEAKTEVEGAFEKEKWNLIADAMVKLGGDKYKGDVLQKQYKKLMLSAATAPPANVKVSKDLAEDDEYE